MTAPIAIISDTHFGVRNDNEVFLNNQVNFFRNHFIPKCREQGVKKIIHAGDVFDKRKNINIKTLSRVREEIFDHLSDFEITIILGNHDVYFKNTNRFNSPKELLTDYNNIKIVESSPTHVTHGDKKILLVPWVTQDNYDDCMGMLERSDANIVIGHFEIQGFDMQPGFPCTHGMSTKVFKNFGTVLSGHFHTRSNQGNIQYLGTQYEMTWTDCEDPKGFSLLHTDGKVEFIPHHDPMFIRLAYTNGGENQVPKKLNSKYVKLVVKDAPEDRAELDGIIESIRLQEPMDLKIIENERDFHIKEDLSVEVEDTMSLMTAYVDTLDIEGNKESVKSLLKEIHTEALEIE